MEFVNVVTAAIASFAFGAFWYTVFAKSWMALSGVELDAEGRKPANRSDPVPYITSFLACVLVSGMMRHIFVLGSIDSIGKGIISGFGIGLFLVTPWIATFYGFSGKPRRLLLIDGGYATFGCTVIGFVLTLF